MKALILAGGRGKRMGDDSSEKNKCMIEVQNKPLIQYSLDLIAEANVSEVVIVIGYKGEEIINRFGNKYKDKTIKYAFQKEQKGLVNAIECAQELIGKDEFILMLGDELMIRPKHSQMIDKYLKENLFGVCGTIEVEDRELIKKTYTIIEQDRIIRLIEKPETPLNNIMGTGNCIFRNEIFSYIPKTPINQKRGEKELVDLIQCAIDDGKIIKSFIICDKYANVNNPEEIEIATSFFTHY